MPAHRLIGQLPERIEILKSKAGVIHADATKSRDEIANDIASLKSVDGSSDRRAYRNLSKDFAGLQMEVGTVLSVVEEVERKAGTEASEVARLDRLSGQSRTPPDLQTQIADLQDSIGKNETVCEKQRGALVQAVKTEHNLEIRSKNLPMQRKPAPTRSPTQPPAKPTTPVATPTQPATTPTPPATAPMQPSSTTKPAATPAINPPTADSKPHGT